MPEANAPHRMSGYDYIDLRDSLLGEAVETLAAAETISLDIPDAPREALDAVGKTVEAWDGDRGMVAATRYAVVLGSLELDELTEDKTVFEARNTYRMIEVSFQRRPSLGDLFELDNLLKPLVSPALPIARTWRSASEA